MNLATEVATIRYLPDAVGADGARRARRGGRLRRPARRPRRTVTTMRSARSTASADRGDAGARRARRATCSSARWSRSRVGARDHGADARRPSHRRWSELNLLVARPGHVRPGLGRRAVLPRSVAGRAARRRRTWTRSSRSARRAAWGYSVGRSRSRRERRHGARGLEPAAYFDSATLIIGFVLLGRWLEARAQGQAGGAIRRLLALEPPVARRIEGDREADVPLADVRAGRPAPGPARRSRAGRRRRGRRRVGGRRVDADRRADAGRDRAGDGSSAATLNADRLVRDAGDAGRRATRCWRRSSSSSGRPRAARRRSSASPTASARSSCRSCWSLAALTFVAWLLFGPGAAAHARAHGVHARPDHRLPLRAWASRRPTAIMVGTGRGAEAGVLFRGGEALEAAAVGSTPSSSTRPARSPRARRGRPSRGGRPASTRRPSSTSRRRSERGTEHPLAEAIVRARARARTWRRGPSMASAPTPGRGVEAATVDGAIARCSSARRPSSRAAAFDRVRLDRGAASCRSARDDAGARRDRRARRAGVSRSPTAVKPGAAARRRTSCIRGRASRSCS